MNGKVLVFSFLAAACASGRPLERAPQVAPLSIEVPRADLTRDQGVRAAADRSAPLPESSAPVPMTSTPTVFRTVTHVVETPAPAAEPQTVTTSEYDDGRWQAWYADDYRYRHYHGRRWRHPFPVNTAVGAGIGAIIGHQHGHRSGRGALIGGGIGLLFDLGRWWR